MGILEFHREDITTALPDVLRGEAQATWQEVAELTKLPHGLREPCTQTIDMRPTLRGGDEVDIAFGYRLPPLREPHYGPVYDFLRPFHTPHKRLFREHREVLQGFEEIGLEPLLIAPLQVFPGVFIAEAHP